jgi:hypothetical protein
VIRGTSKIAIENRGRRKAAPFACAAGQATTGTRVGAVRSPIGAIGEAQYDPNNINISENRASKAPITTICCV